MFLWTFRSSSSSNCPQVERSIQQLEALAETSDATRPKLHEAHGCIHFRDDLVIWESSFDASH